MRRSVLCLVFLTLIGCSSNAETVEVQFRRGDGSVSPMVKAEIAATPGSRELGLMYRKTLGDLEGMLFVFPEESQRSFWMKNTYVELDMVFIDAQKKIVSIIARAVPLSTSSRPSQGPAKYVLEVKGGQAEAWGLKAGGELIVQGTLPEPH